MKPRQVLNHFGVVAALVMAPAFTFGGCSSSSNGGTDSSVGGVDATAGVDAGASSSSKNGGTDSSVGGVDATAGVDAGAKDVALDSAAIDGGGGTVAQQCLTGLVSPFAAMAPDWANWSSSSCSSVAAANGSLVLTQNEPCSAASPNAIAGLAPPNVLCGDFDVQVDFAVTGLVAGVTGGIFASMRTNDPTITTNGMTIERYAAGYLPPSSQSYQNYKSYTTNKGEDATSVLVPTTDVTGRLRLTRAGTTVKSYYWKTGAPDSQWVLVNTATLTNTPWVLVLYEGDNSAANAGPKAPYSVTFSNLLVIFPGATDAGTTDAGGGADATPARDAATDGGADAPSDAGIGDLATAGDAGCTQLATVPDFTRGYWLICNATDSSPGRIWTGILTFTSEVPTCDGASVMGSYDWTSNGGAHGTTVATGTYVAATRKFVIAETALAGLVSSATELMTYDPQTDRMVDGSWEPTAGKWSTAIRVVSDGGIPACTP